MMIESRTSKARQSRFQIVWFVGGCEQRFFYTDDKVIATAYVAGIVTAEIARGDAPEVEEGSTMEPIQHPDGSRDRWNKIRVRTYVIRSTVRPTQVKL